MTQKLQNLSPRASAYLFGLPYPEKNVEKASESKAITIERAIEKRKTYKREISQRILKAALRTRNKPAVDIEDARVGAK